MITLEELLRDAAPLDLSVTSSALNWPQIEICGCTHDSRSVQPGWLFCCIPGSSVDGHDYAQQAVDAGAVAVLAERELSVESVPVGRTPAVRDALGPVAAAVYNHPDRSLRTIGVTGTSGKTSVVHILAAILEQARSRYETIGTLSGVRTTPEAPELQASLRAAVDAGVETIAMEVSSHALEMGRVDGLSFTVAVFTNLGHDHLDFHGDMEHYFEAKARLFETGRFDTAVVNVDDAHGRRLAERVPSAALRPVSMTDAVDLSSSGAESTFTWRGHPIRLQMTGRHNVMNALLAGEAAVLIGVDPLDVADGLCAVSPPPGRMEFVNAGQPFPVIVDYAHKPEALESVLGACREVVPGGRITVVVGCGGDRDPLKRPRMAEIAERLADVVVLTSDNPRGEEPRAIIEAMVAGMQRPDGAKIIEDRAEAIEWAVTQSGAGDLVLLAGKGHETTQVVGDSVLDFDDRLVAYATLSRMVAES